MSVKTSSPFLALRWCRVFRVEFELSNSLVLEATRKFLREGLFSVPLADEKMNLPLSVYSSANSPLCSASLNIDVTLEATVK